MPAAYVMFGVSDWKVAMSGWTNSLPIIIFSAFIISFALEKSGLIKRLAYFSILKTQGSYVKLCFAILIVGWIASLMTSCNAHMIMIIIGLGICNALGFKKFDMRSAGVFLAVALGTISCEQWQYYVTPMTVLGPAYLRVDPAGQVRWIDNIIYCWPMAIFAVIYLGFVLKLFVPKTAKFDVNMIKKEYDAMGSLSAIEKKMIVLLTIFMLLLVSSSWIDIDIYVPFLSITIAMFLPGIHLAGDDDLKKVPWAMVVFINACMSMGAIASSIGISEAISSYIMPIFKNLGLLESVSLLWIVIALLNIFLTPIAIYAAFGEPFMVLFNEMGINPHSVLFLTMMGGDAIFLPHEHMYYLIIFGFGMISMKTFVKLWSIKLPVQLACILLFQIPYWKLIGFI